MVAPANIILLPPPGARGPDRARVEEGADRRRGPSRASARPGEAPGYAAYAEAAAGPAPGGGFARARPRSFADELVGESGKAPAALAFAAQRIAQERLGAGAYFEDWRGAIAAYARARDSFDRTSGFAA
jgi:hypothetical protein